MTTIVAAALKLPRGTIWSWINKRHGDLIHEMTEYGESVGDIANAEQGFMTDQQEFVGRVEARVIAKAAGQMIRETHPTELFSEDLW